MKNFVLMAATLILGFTLSIGDAEARRFGGGGSFGMKRSQSMAPKRADANQAQKPNTPATTPQAQPKRSWGGMLGGLAAGLGLAALASYRGFGEEMATIMLIALLAMVALGVFAYFKRKKLAEQGGQTFQFAGAGAGAASGANTTGAGNNFGMPQAAGAMPFNASDTPASAPVSSNANIPADFDAEAFIRNAKVSFIRLQAANDARNLDDIREFTSPEVFAEVKLAMDERGNAPQETNVVQLDAQVIEVAEEENRYVVSVHFYGQISEEQKAPEAFEEIWHMTKPRNGSSGWVLAGIQQLD